MSLVRLSTPTCAFMPKYHCCSTRYALQFAAPPDEAMLAQLVERDIDEEILFRRGLALELDKRR